MIVQIKSRGVKNKKIRIIIIRLSNISDIHISH